MALGLPQVLAASSFHAFPAFRRGPGAQRPTVVWRLSSPSGDGLWEGVEVDSPRGAIFMCLEDFSFQKRAHFSLFHKRYFGL